MSDKETVARQQRQELHNAINAAVKILEPMLNSHEVKIYDLSDAVVKGVAFEWHRDAYVALYQKLYITQAALCRISQKLDDTAQSVWVELSPVGARLRGYHEVRTQEKLGQETLCQEKTPSRNTVSNESARPNEAFFLNPDNFFGITADDVQKLLTQFWTNYESFERKEDALFVLGLADQSLDALTWRDIQSAYRKKAALHHPDKGGDPIIFIEIRTAYEQLKPLFTS